MSDENNEAEPFDRNDYLKFQSGRGNTVRVDRERLCTTILDRLVEQGRLAGLSEAVGAYRVDADEQRRIRAREERELIDAKQRLARAEFEIEQLRLKVRTLRRKRTK